jgi:hypothetical protein
MSLTFNLLNRERYRRPYSGSGVNNTSIDANFVNVASTSISNIEAFALNSVGIESSTAKASSICTVAQRWLYYYDKINMYGGTSSAPNFLLPLSPVILEDSGVIPLQSIYPGQSLVSLISSLFISIPKFSTQAIDNTILGPSSVPVSQPSWCTILANIPRLSFGIRYQGASGTMAFEGITPSLFDAGTGQSPYILLRCQYGTPDRYGTDIPIGLYEVTLLGLNQVT